MVNYDLGNSPTEREKYELSSKSPITYPIKKYTPSNIGSTYRFSPGEFPLMKGRLPELFGTGYIGRHYPVAEMIEEEAKIKGYRKPERISLPYLGSPESQTNKTSL